ncbi:DUF928 domain-containing protein [Trichocoleus sp. FACHB-90]|uniref:DUF928 domain-containing protein n=1 Tax=Cyanophyceae TaxID=3028117 RepID=UPI001685212D|nr:DUF928 domain-containing protein [Trichocoleus sp. FACHB-90]MBD1929957.1 DUF928 domain-containing protein [Trichocoleus sp. FACHB-90]
MTWTKLPFKQIKKLTFVISFAFVSFTPVQAQLAEQVILVHRSPSRPSTELLFEQPPPPGQGAPSGTKPGGSRNACPVGQNSVTPLVPVTQQPPDKELRWGYTTEAHPTFWFYMPYDSQSIKSSKFSLRNRSGETVYETDLKVTGLPGVISISLPSTAPPLEIGNWYQTYLFVDVYCIATAPLQKDSAQAWVKREQPNATLKTQLESATPQQRAILYVKYGFLYDALGTLAELRITNPMNDDWAQLLRFVGLEAIAPEPIVNCCTPNGT